MSSPKGVRYGKAFVELLTDNSPLIRGLKAARTTISGWSRSIASIGARITAPLALLGAAGTAGIALASERLAAMGDRADKAAGRMGVTVEAMTELDHAANLSGANLETLEPSLATLGKNASEAARGNATLAAEFRKIGLNAQEFVKLSPDRQLEALADKLQGIENPAHRSTMAMKLMGEGGRKLLPMMAGGAAGIQAMRQEARDLGISLAGEDTTAASKFIDAMTRLRAAGQAAAFKFAGALFPVLTDLVNFLAKSVGAVARWVKENRALILTGLAVAAAVLGVGVAFLGISATLGVIGAAIGGLVALLTTLGAAVGFLLSPVGLTLAAVAGLTYAFFRFTTTGQQTLTWLSQAWQTLAGDATSAWGGIVAAIQAGDLQAAFAVGMAFLQLEWTRATNFLAEKWASFRDVVVEFWSGAVLTFSQLWTDATADFETVWIHTTDFLADVWDAVTNRFRQSWNVVQGGIAKGIGYLIAKLNGLDPADVLAEIDAETNRKNQASQAGTDERINGRAATRQSRLEDVQQLRTGTQGELVDQARRDRLTRIAASDQAAAARAEALTKAQAKLADAVGRATAASRAEEARKTEAAVATGQAGLQTAIETRTAAAVDVRSSEGLGAIIAAVQGMGALDQTALNTAKTAAATEKMATEQAQTNQHLQDLNDAGNNETADLDAAGAGVP